MAHRMPQGGAFRAENGDVESPHSRFDDDKTGKAAAMNTWQRGLATNKLALGCCAAPFLFLIVATLHNSSSQVRQHTSQLVNRTSALTASWPAAHQQQQPTDERLVRLLQGLSDRLDGLPPHLLAGSAAPQQKVQALPASGAAAGRHEGESLPANSLVPEFVHHLYKRSPCSKEQYPQNGAHYWFHGKHWEGLPGGSQLLATAHAQRAIYEHQHPASCADVKFLVHKSHGYGIGSQLHVFGVAIQVAMKLNRVYVEAYDSATTYTHGSFCEANSTMDMCFFQPFSGCTWEDVGGPIDSFAGYDSNNEASQVDERVLVMPLAYATREMPPQVRDILEAVDLIPPEWHFRWWRAQAAAYTMRMREVTLAAIKETRDKIFAGQEIQDGTIAVHVRHGDKAEETELIPDEVYWQKAQAIYEADTTLRKAIYLQTYDPVTVEYFETVTRENGWTLQYVDIPRRDNETGVTTWTYAGIMGGTTEMLNSLVNLQLSLECWAWVGTQSSNWGRLMDEMRSTIACRANRIWLDAQMGDPPDKLDEIKP